MKTTADGKLPYHLSLVVLSMKYVQVVSTFLGLSTVNRSGMVRLGGKLQRVRKYMSGNTLYLCHVTNKRYAKERTIFNTQKCNLIQPNYCPKILFFHAVKARKTTRYGERYRS